MDDLSVIFFMVYVTKDIEVPALKKTVFNDLVKYDLFRIKYHTILL